MWENCGSGCSVITQVMTVPFTYIPNMAFPSASILFFNEGCSLCGGQICLFLESEVMRLTLDLKWEWSVGGLSLSTTFCEKHPYMVVSPSSVAWLSSVGQLSLGPSCAHSQMMSGTGVYLEA